MRLWLVAALLTACDQGKPEYGSEWSISLHEIDVAQMDPPANWHRRDITLSGDGTLVVTTKHGTRRSQLPSPRFAKLAHELEKSAVLAAEDHCGLVIDHGLHTHLAVALPQGRNDIEVGWRCDDPKLVHVVTSLREIADRAGP